VLWLKGGRVVWWHFCASFAQIWGARHGLFELAKSEKSEGWQKNIPPPLESPYTAWPRQVGGMGVAFFKFGGGYLQTTHYIYYDIKYTKNFLPPPIPPKHTTP
jgi:hypothetical protein